MNVIKKFFCLLFIFLVLLFYCVNLKSERRFNQQNQNLQNIEFIEIRRLNVSSNFKRGNGCYNHKRYERDLPKAG